MIIALFFFVVFLAMLRLAWPIISWLIFIAVAIHFFGKVSGHG
jgi:flagellar biosynthesis protein FliR